MSTYFELLTRPGYSRLAEARDFSSLMLERLRASLSSNKQHLDALDCISVAGSLSRLEAHPDSDIDLVMIAKADATLQAVDDAAGLAMELIQPIGLRLPKPDGIYGRPLDPGQLFHVRDRGVIAQPARIFGSRMHLLIDARAVYQADRLVEMQGRAVEWFTTGQPGTADRFGYLNNELLRYMHGYRAWQRFKLSRSKDDSWALRQAKFYGSRLLIFVGLLLLIERAREHPEGLVWLRDRLELTPMERLALALGGPDTDEFLSVLEQHHVIFERLCDPQVRADLLVCGPDDSRPRGGLSAGARELLAAGHELQTRLARAIVARSPQSAAAFVAQCLC